MGAARNLAPKWVDPDLPWGEPAKEEDTPLLAVVDRFHNHEEMSPEGMAQAISELQETVRALDGRLAEARSEAAAAAAAAKGLGGNMVQLGDALTQRMRDLETDASEDSDRAAKKVRALERANRRTRQFGLGLAAVLAVAVAAGWMLRPQPSAPAKAPAPAQVLYSPDQPAPNNN